MLPILNEARISYLKTFYWHGWAYPKTYWKLTERQGIKKRIDRNSTQILTIQQMFNNKLDDLFDTACHDAMSQLKTEQDRLFPEAQWEVGE